MFYFMCKIFNSERVSNWRDPNYVKDTWDDKPREEPRSNRNSSFERRNSSKRSDRDEEDWSRPLPRDERLERCFSLSTNLG